MSIDTLSDSKLFIKNNDSIKNMEKILSPKALEFVCHFESKFCNRRRDLLNERLEEIDKLGYTS